MLRFQKAKGVFIINLQESRLAQQNVIQYWQQHYEPTAPRKIITKLAIAARNYQLELPVADRMLYRAAVSYTSLSGWQHWQVQRQFLKSVAKGATPALAANRE
ncbi:MAG: hypothetical protein DUD28_08875 [Lactobacillus sp.]|nr:MAG: hypothetical protein DUD28_08875 [Lactobacillus sp.]